MVVSSHDAGGSGMGRFFDSVSLSMGVIEVGVDDFSYVAVNEAGARFHGLKPAEMVGKTTHELGEPDEVRAEWITRIAECAAAGSAVRFEYRRPTVSGDRFRCATVSQLEGSANRFCFIIEDLTEFKVQLRAQEKKLKSLVANIPGIVFRAIVDQNWKLDFMSETAVNLLGYTPEEFVTGAIRFSDLVLAEDYPGLVHAAERAREERGSYMAEYRIRNRAGQILTVVEQGKVAWDDISQCLVLDGAIFDATERRLMIEQLIEAREAAMEASQLKSEFLANMSHEIRTPLNGVIGMTELMLTTPLDSDQRDFAETILQSADSLLHIISDILDFSKIEAGKMTLERVELDLVKVVHDSAEPLAAKAAAKGVELVVDVQEGLPTYRYGDPVRLRQILTNLISNAIKFTEHGEIAVRAEHLPTRPTWVRLSVRDTGIGIPPERHDAIFDCFTQADGSTTRRYGGTGLGLAIVRQLANLMGGHVGLESSAGVGSTFWVEIPFEIQAIQPQIDASFRDDLEGLRVLIVDDNETNRKVLTRLLSSHGCITLEAQHAIEALSILHETEAVDLALLDYQMPEMDGLELARQVRASSFPQPEMIMLSSVGQLVGQVTLEACGIARSLTKPVRQNELLTVIYEVRRGLAASRALSEQVVEHPNASVLKILVVEDNFVNRKVCQKILQRHGCDIDFAENGREALEKVESTEYGLVLMDLQMPVMDGFEATLAIRAMDRQRGRHTPIVALTAHAMKGDREKCLGIGMDGYLTKPVKPQDLDAVVERWSSTFARAA